MIYVSAPGHQIAVSHAWTPGSGGLTLQHPGGCMETPCVAARVERYYSGDLRRFFRHIEDPVWDQGVIVLEAGREYPVEAFVDEDLPGDLGFGLHLLL